MNWKQLQTLQRAQSSLPAQSIDHAAASAVFCSDCEAERPRCCYNRNISRSDSVLAAKHDAY
jgi:hypothetical protein